MHFLKRQDLRQDFFRRWRGPALAGLGAVWLTAAALAQGAAALEARPGQTPAAATLTAAPASTAIPAATPTTAPASTTITAAPAASATLVTTAPTTAVKTALPAMVVQRVSASAWYVEGLSALGSGVNQNFISNAAFVVTPAGVVVIDALGSPALATRLLAEIGKITPLPVTHVIITHYHADHVYGLQVFKAQGARILAHSAARSYLNSDNARLRLEASRQELAHWINDETRLVPADEWIDSAQELNVGGVRLLVQPVGPSHTPEDLVIYLPQEKVLFAGDLVFRSRIPFVGQADSGHWIEALDTLLGFDAGVIVPGHGPLSVQARQDMQLTRDYLIHLRASMGQAARNMEPFEQAYEAADWSRFEHLPLFRLANRMNAYNTYLLMEHESP